MLQRGTKRKSGVPAREESDEEVKPLKTAPVQVPAASSKAKARRAVLDSDEEEEAPRTTRRSKAASRSLAAMMDIDDGTQIVHTPAAIVL